MSETLSFSAAFLIGLLGSTHCVGMCGGIMGALSYAVPPEQRSARKLFPLLLCYNIGRIFSYTLAGAIIGATSWFLAGQFPLLGNVLRIFAALMLIAMGLYLANWWSALRHLERAGNAVWKHIQPKLSALMPVTSTWRALLVGTLWGWIPCGLIYSTLTWAATAGNWQQSALIMLCFGLGTLPAVLATGIFLEGFKKLMQLKGVRISAGLLIILFGIWTLPLPGSHSGHAPNAHSDHQQQSNEMMDEPHSMNHDQQPMQYPMNEPTTPPQITEMTQPTPNEHHHMMDKTTPQKDNKQPTQ
jgi:uncharacterized protein